MGRVSEQPERYPPTASGGVSPLRRARSTWSGIIPLRRARSTWSGIIHPLRRALFTHCVGQYLPLRILPFSTQGFSSPSEPLSTSQARVIGRDGGGYHLCPQNLRGCKLHESRVRQEGARPTMLYYLILALFRCLCQEQSASYTTPRRRESGRVIGRDWRLPFVPSKCRGCKLHKSTTS